MPEESGAGTASLEFLRAPRNSLFIQWKDEAKTAIRRAYDLYHAEVRHHHHIMRHISAYELIEGVDGTLCNAFAEFTGQVLAMTRMRNPTNSIYVSQQAMSIAVRNCGISLQRLLNASCRYVVAIASPGISRKAYFNSGGSSLMMVPAPPTRMTIQYRGAWGVNMEGSS